MPAAADAVIAAHSCLLSSPALTVITENISSFADEISVFSTSSGWQHHQAAAEDRQEDGAGGGLEEDPGGPEGHGGFASASRRQGEHSSEGGEAHFLFAPQTAWQEKTSCSTKERHEKPLNAYKCH